jgi:hypothetical protein
MSKLFRYIQITLLLCSVVFLWVYLGIGYIECRDIGGQYVRGLFWMECVKP